MHLERRKVGRPVSPEEAKKGLEERTVEVSATVERPVVSKEARVVEEVAVGKTAREREEVVRDTVRRSKIEVEDETRAARKPPADRLARLRPFIRPKVKSAQVNVLAMPANPRSLSRGGPLHYR